MLHLWITSSTELCRYAEKYGLAYEPKKCNNEGDCKGTCPKCEAELADLQDQLQAKGITDITSDKTYAHSSSNTLKKVKKKYLNLPTLA